MKETLDYFSDREQKPSPPTTTALTEPAWKGIAAAINHRIEDGSFGASYPERCQDGTVPIGTAVRAFWHAVAGEIPELYKPELSEGIRSLSELAPPSLFDVMDLIQFCWRAVGAPKKIWYHSYFHHSHLEFDVPAGQTEFRNQINRIFSRNSMAYELKIEGIVERLMPAHISPVIHAEYHTGDSDLDRMLDEARVKFLSPNDVERHKSIQILWDAWERAKTLDGNDKRSGIKSLLDQAAGQTTPKLRDVLEEEAKTLTSIGNRFLIRHSETDKEPIDLPQHVDYIAYRMFSFLYLILRRFRDTSKLQTQPDDTNDDEIPF